MANNIFNPIKPNSIVTNFVFTKIILNQRITGNGCNAIIFVNSGAAAVEVNGVQLTTNQSLSLTGNALDQDETSYNVVFTGAGVRNLNIVQKFNTYE